ncbi:MAG: SdiA-regulated domain-containing protein [Ignavibacteriales bacterium]|nr:SdiA-regulated domain-containing protein [Ignavibacteriales bacterium]
MKRPGLESYDFNPKKVRQFELPKSLREISGLAASTDGRLFAHHDESGDIFQLKSSDGTVVKKFSLGPRRVSEDFEGIAIAGDVFYLVTSGGIVHEFREGKDKEKVTYRTYETALSEEYDVEGLCYDPKTDCLLLACKGYSGLANLGSKAVFAFSLATKKVERAPRFLLSLKELEAKLNDKPFHPSGIEYVPESGTFYILDSRIKSVIEISADGKILNAIKLKNSIHRQPEGITLLPDGTLCIGDEGQTHGMLTLYRKRK